MGKWKRYQVLRQQGVVDANTYEDIASQRKVAEVELNTDVEEERQNEAQLKQAREQFAKTEVSLLTHGWAGHRRFHQSR